MAFSNFRRTAHQILNSATPRERIGLGVNIFTVAAAIFGTAVGAGSLALATVGGLGAVLLQRKISHILRRTNDGPLP